MRGVRMSREVEELYPLRRRGRWGYIRKDGSWHICPQYDQASSFCEGRAGIRCGGLYYVIDASGRRYNDCGYESMRLFSEGMAAVALDEQYGYVDAGGSVVIRPRFQYALEFSEGLAPVQIGGAWRYINRWGRFVSTARFAHACVFAEERAFVATDDGWVAINRAFEPLSEQRYANTGRGFSEGLAWVDQGDRIGYIDRNAKLVIDAKYSHGGRFHQGTAPAACRGVWGFIDRDGDWVIEPRFVPSGRREYEPGAKEFCGGMAPACDRNGLWGFINETGDWVVSARFETAYPFRGTLAIVGKGGRLGYIDRAGNVVGECS